MNQHFEKKGLECFSTASCEVLREFLGKQNLWFLLLCDAYIITLMPMFATYRVKVEQTILFVKIMNQLISRSVRIKGSNTLYLSIVHSKHTASYTG